MRIGSYLCNPTGCSLIGAQNVSWEVHGIGVGIGILMGVCRELMIQEPTISSLRSSEDRAGRMAVSLG